MTDRILPSEITLNTNIRGIYWLIVKLLEVEHKPFYVINS